jgi:phosphatidate cytidylyltransferase
LETFKKVINSRVGMGVIIAVFIVCFYILGLLVSPYFMDAFIAVIIFLAVNEMRIVLRRHFNKAIEWLLIAYSALLIFPYRVLDLGFLGVVYYTLSVFVVGAAFALFDKKCPKTAIQNFTLILLYPGLVLSSMLFINDSYFKGGPYLNFIGLALVFGISMFTDTFAMLGGKLFGKHKLASEISPKKTIEGAIVGIVGGLIGASVIAVLFEIITWPFFTQHGFLSWGMNTSNTVIAYILIGFFGAVFTQIGDLLASYFKRQWEIKDFSQLLGKHGGVMDRFDGIMLNAAFISLVFTFVFPTAAVIF